MTIWFPLLCRNMAIRSKLVMPKRDNPIQVSYAGTWKSDPSTHYNHKNKYTLSHTIKSDSWHIIICLSHSGKVWINNATFTSIHASWWSINKNISHNHRTATITYNGFLVTHIIQLLIWPYSTLIHLLRLFSKVWNVDHPIHEGLHIILSSTYID